jgi:CheY-like chemotaxis protein
VQLTYNHLEIEDLLTHKINFDLTYNIDQNNLEDNGLVLVIDDNPADFLIIRRAIKNVDPHSTFVHIVNGEEAIDILIRMDTGEITKPKCIILDINMPKVDGFDVLRHLKKSNSLKNVPVIMCSSSSNKQDIGTAMELGAVSYVTKAFALKDYVKTVQETYMETVNMDI